MKIKLSKKVEERLSAIERQINLLNAEKNVIIQTSIYQDEKEGEVEKIENGYIHLKK